MPIPAAADVKPGLAGKESREPSIGCVRRHHRPLLWGFAAIVVGHWTEHLVQAFQIYVLDLPVPQSRGIMGQYFPWLVTSEFMHYGYALVMLLGLWVLRGGFNGTARQWWMLSFTFQFWHHFEHLLLFLQATLDFRIGTGLAPSSLLQFVVPRVELHLFYNTVVTLPMIVAMVFHSRSAGRRRRRCER